MDDVDVEEQGSSYIVIHWKTESVSSNYNFRIVNEVDSEQNDS